MRSSKCKAEIRCSELSPHHQGGEGDILGVEKKRHRKVTKRKRPISVLEIKRAKTALKKLEAKVKEKRRDKSHEEQSGRDESNGGRGGINAERTEGRSLCNELDANNLILNCYTETTIA